METPLTEYMYCAKYGGFGFSHEFEFLRQNPGLTANDQVVSYFTEKIGTINALRLEITELRSRLSRLEIRCGVWFR